MIVRDEAEMLPGFLERAAPLWDELVVVDTGSRDGTVALAEAAGAKVVRFEWVDDFAAARNTSLEAATGDWICVLDADEYVDPAFVAEARAAIGSPGVGAATVRIRNLFEHGHHRDSQLLRLFRRDPGIRYRHAIHEDASDDVAAMLQREGLAAVALAAPVIHHGYSRDRAAERNKRERDQRMLRSCIEQDSGDLYSRFKLLELARFWSDPDLGGEVAAELLDGLAAARVDLRGRSYGGELLVEAARTRHPGCPSDALGVVERHADRCDGSPALWLGRAELRELTGDLDAAREDFERCLGATDATPQRVTTRPLLGLARLDLAVGDVPSALERIDRALGWSPRDPEALLAGLALRLTDDVAGAVEFAERRDVPASLCAEGVVSAARGRLAQGRVEAAAALMQQFVARAPALGIGVLVCDLIRARDSELELDLEQHEADEALLDWVRTLHTLPDVSLLQRFVAASPAIVPIFPWLAELLE